MKQKDEKFCKKFIDHFMNYKHSQLCPHCQTGADNLKIFPDFCPHLWQLKVGKGIGMIVAHKDGTSSVYDGYECGQFKEFDKKSENPNPNYRPPAFKKRYPPQLNADTDHDAVNHPSHYTDGKIECIDYIQDKLTPEEFRGYIKGNIIKYITRERLKNGDEDLKKAQFYLNKLIETLGGKSNG